jgi:hypothetical protein
MCYNSFFFKKFAFEMTLNSYMEFGFLPSWMHVDGEQNGRLCLAFVLLGRWGVPYFHVLPSYDYERSRVQARGPAFKLPATLG